MMKSASFWGAVAVCAIVLLVFSLTTKRDHGHDGGHDAGHNAVEHVEGHDAHGAHGGH